MGQVPIQNRTSEKFEGQAERFYFKIVPRVRALQQSIGDLTKMMPEIIRTGNELVMFEYAKDLETRLRTFRMWSDVHHNELIMNRLAKWHATTAHLIGIDPDYFLHDQSPPISDNSTNLNEFFIDSIRACAETVRKWTGCEKYGDKLLRMSNALFKETLLSFFEDHGGFNVLNISNILTNNIIFTYNTAGIPEDLLFLNSASGVVGSPGLDLSHYIFTTITKGQGDGHLDLLLRVYHEELIKTLVEFGYKKKLPSVLDIQVEFLRKSRVGLLTSLLTIPMTELQGNNPIEWDRLIGDAPEKASTRRLIFDHPNYRNLIEPVLEFAYRKGLLEV